MAADEITAVLQQVQGWPIPMRIELASQILETVQNTPKKTLPRGPSAAEVAARFQSTKPAPDDETVERWLDEHRIAKYGS